jgi:DNA-binding LacI/PurR family transcriptional regulator
LDKLQKIALKVGVSPNTVLRVLRGENKEVWPSAIRRATEIRRVAQELAYIPNGSARAMRRGRFNCVALLLSANRGRSHLPDDLFNQIHDALHEQGMRLIVSKLPDEQLTNKDVVPAILRELSCDGLLINYTDHIPGEMTQLIGQYQIPSIWVNCRQDSDCVYYDDFGGAMAATQHLLALGHRRIVHLDFATWDEPRMTHYSRMHRYEGYVQAMRLAGVAPVPRDKFAGVPPTQRLEATRAMLTSPDRPTAVIAYDSGERVLYAAALAGLRVPEDLSVMTYAPHSRRGDRVTQGETFFGRVLTSMLVPSEYAGQKAVSLLLERIAEPKRQLPPCVVPLTLDPGETCGPAPA